jgi:hypothetical protein
MMFRDVDVHWIHRWVRADAVAIAASALWALTLTHGSWMWFFILFLVPDASMAGYLAGPRAGAILYNVAHMYACPLALLAIGVARHQSFTTTAALTWIAHVAFDHALGYGLKLPTSFEETALGPIGRLRRAERRAARQSPGGVWRQP